MPSMILLDNSCDGLFMCPDREDLEVVLQTEPGAGEGCASMALTEASDFGAL